MYGISRAYGFTRIWEIFREEGAALFSIGELLIRAMNRKLRESQTKKSCSTTDTHIEVSITDFDEIWHKRATVIGGPKCTAYFVKYHYLELRYEEAGIF